MADGDMGPLSKAESLDLIEQLLDDATETLKDMASVFDIMTGQHGPINDGMMTENEAAIHDQNMHIDRLHRLKKSITRYFPDAP